MRSCGQFTHATISVPSRLLKKPSVAFSISPSERRFRASLRSAALRRPVWQRGFRIAPIFNDLQPSKMSVALYRLAGCKKTAFFNSLLENFRCQLEWSTNKLSAAAPNALSSGASPLCAIMVAMIFLVSSRVLTRGKGLFGTGRSRNSHRGSQPCFTS